MTLFLILVALAVYQLTTRKKLAQIYRQFDRKQIKRLSDAPFYLTCWALVFIFVANTLFSLTDMIGELFNVDNYISLFSGGWLGLILRFLRSNGFIGDIQEPMVLLQYKDTISTIYTITIIFGIICGAALVGYCRELIKAQLNKTAILTYNYLCMACELTSFLLIMWGLYEFNNLLNHAVIFHMEEIYLYFTLLSIGTCGATLFLGRRELKKLFDLPQCESLTWQQLLAKIKISTDKGQKPITEGQIIGISLGLSFLISAWVILSTLPVSEETEQEQYEQMNTEEGEINDPTQINTENVSVQNDDETCIAILQKYYTASFEQIEEWGGRATFETARFMQYTKHLDFVPLTSTQDYDIGDGLVVESIEPYSNLDHAYIVMANLEGGFGRAQPTCVIMKEEEGTWKIDNISCEPYEKVFIDYSKPASYYNYAFPDGGDGDVINELEKKEENFEENENFISL